MTAVTLGSRLWWGLLVLIVLLWGAGALVSVSIPGIPVTPLPTLVAAPGVAYAQEIALALGLGSLVTLLWSKQPRVRRWAMGWLAIALGLAVASAAALQSDVTARPLGTDTSGLSVLLFDSAVGQAVLVQVIGLLSALLLIAVGGIVDRRWPTWCAVALVGICVAAPAVAGHAGLSSQHQVAGVATGLHAVAISLWVGGLAVVSVRCVQEPGEASKLLPRFSLLALVCVIVAAESGVLSASLTVGNLNDLVASTYGSLIVAKATVLAWLIRMGWLQRRRALDLLPDASVPRIVARIAGTELVLMASAIAASVVLVRIGPPPVPMAGFAPLSLVALAVGAGMLLARCYPKGWRIANAWPETAMAVLLLVLVEVGGVGLLRTVLGVPGLAIEVGLILVAGWLAMVSLRQSIQSGSVVTAFIALVGLPVVLAVNALIGDEVSWRMSIVVGLIGEGLLVIWWAMARRAVDQPLSDEVKVSA